MSEMTQEEIFEMDALAMSLMSDVDRITGKAQRDTQARIRQVHTDRDFDRIRVYGNLSRPIFALSYADAAVDMLRADGVEETAPLLTTDVLSIFATFKSLLWVVPSTEQMKVVLEEVSNRPLIAHLVGTLGITDPNELREKINEMRAMPAALVQGAI